MSEMATGQITTKERDRQAEVMRIVQAQNPKFFEDEEIRGLAAIVIREMAEEIQSLGAVEKFMIVSETIRMMYLMGSAALKTVRGGEGLSMGKICIREYKAKNGLA